MFGRQLDLWCGTRSKLSACRQDLVHGDRSWAIWGSPRWMCSSEGSYPYLYPLSCCPLWHTNTYLFSLTVPLTLETPLTSACYTDPLTASAVLFELPFAVLISSMPPLWVFNYLSAFLSPSNPLNRSCETHTILSRHAPFEVNGNLQTTAIKNKHYPSAIKHWCNLGKN